MFPVYILTYFQDWEDKMRPHTKFRVNRSIFREVMTFRKKEVSYELAYDRSETRLLSVPLHGTDYQISFFVCMCVSRLVR